MEGDGQWLTNQGNRRIKDDDNVYFIPVAEFKEDQYPVNTAHIVCNEYIPQRERNFTTHSSRSKYDYGTGRSSSQYPLILKKQRFDSSHVASIRQKDI